MEDPTVPSIDVNASLKIESEKMVDEDLPKKEKEGKVLLVLGTIMGVFVLIGVVVLGFVFFDGRFWIFFDDNCSSTFDEVIN